MEPDIKREFDRLHRELKQLKELQNKSTWVTPMWILEITGWTKRKLQTAREQHIIEFKESGTGSYLYKLESIPEQFIINKPQKQAS